MQPYRRLIESIEAEGAAALVSLVETEGSSPREAGAAMVVRPSGGFHGTIGGGEMEWRALAEAREALDAGARGGAAPRRRARPRARAMLRRAGRVAHRDFRRARPRSAGAARRGRTRRPLRRRRADRDGRARRAEDRGRGGAARAGAWREEFGDAAISLYLFGAGHVGRALALALAPLPFALRWIDSREAPFPSARRPTRRSFMRASRRPNSPPRPTARWSWS